MAGHSKWANIKHRKQSVDARKALIYAQLSKEISVAAKLGGSDPSYNFRLRNAIDRAKAVGMPNDNIQRAVDKFNSSKENFEEILYEGYGPSGVAILVEAATNNRNRTAAELRSIFNKYSGNLGESGCVSWGFKRYGIIFIPRNNELTEDILLNTLEENEIELEDFDFENDSDNYLILTSIDNFESSVDRTKHIYNNASGEFGYIANNIIKLNNSEISDKFESLIELLENNDDVQRVFHNGTI
ncbi:MAG: YebC/PmpR family DNA-binding transcriptional regulator [Candidatus Caenarcaniphilales bacterium]|nr:YebC/PmpR family DNA-binding transcriptional regulator [Candidatus Caenarcaniphilales bacterium]